MNAQPDPILELVEALRSATNTREIGKNKGKGVRQKQVANAVLDLLIAAGASPELAVGALKVLGHHVGEDMQLIDLYQGALFREKCAKAMGETTSDGRLKRSVMTQIHTAYATMWGEYTGNPSYGPEEFKAAYNKWKRDTGGGGFSLAYRRGREKKVRVSLIDRHEENG